MSFSRKIITVFASCALVLSFSSLALQVYAQTTTAPPKLDYSGLVKCDGVVDTTSAEPYRQTQCDFNALMNTINKIVTYLFFISIPIATALFAYGGFLYMTGSQKNIGKAKEMFWDVAIGFGIMLVAWIAVYTVVKWFTTPSSGATTFIQTPK